MLRFAAVLLLLVAMPARANLGESVADIVKRYGKPVAFSEANAQNPFGTLVFMAGPYQMIVFLSNNIEVGTRITKKDKSAFLPEEMTDIMNADAPTPWISAPSTDPTCLQWNRADKATVLYDKDKKILIFTSLQMADAMRHPSPVASTNAAPQQPHRPPGNFAPAAPTQWEPATAPPTNAAPAPAPAP